MRSWRTFVLALAAGGCLAVTQSGCSSTSSWDRAIAEYRPNLKGLRLPGGSPVAPPQMQDTGRTKQSTQSRWRTKNIKIKHAPLPGDDPATGGSNTESINSRKLEKADVVSITLHSLQVIKLEEVIDERGKISLPYVGSLKLEGLTPAEAEERVWQIYVVEKKIFQKTLVVTIIPSARTFFIKGEVYGPKPYLLRPGLTLSQAIATAGGPTVWANTKKIKIRKESGKTTTHNLEMIEAGKQRDPVIEPGDIIEVPRRWY